MYSSLNKQCFGILQLNHRILDFAFFINSVLVHGSDSHSGHGNTQTAKIKKHKSYQVTIPIYLKGLYKPSYDTVFAQTLDEWGYQWKTCCNSRNIPAPPTLPLWTLPALSWPLTFLCYNFSDNDKHTWLHNMRTHPFSLLFMAIPLSRNWMTDHLALLCFTESSDCSGQDLAPRALLLCPVRSLFWTRGYRLLIN